MKILVLGANGMAGHTVSLYFIKRGHEVSTFSKSPFPYGKNITGDAMDRDFLKSLLTAENFDAVINCIGLLIKDCERYPDRAVYLNSYLPHFAAKILKNRKTKLIHMSTDCVFSTEKGNYSEKNFPDGKAFYDRTKALGEINDSKNLTFRNSIIGPDINVKGVGLFNWFMKQSVKIDGYTKVIWTGVTTLTLAEAMEKAIEENLTGIYNLVNNKAVTKFDLLTLFNKYFKKGSLTIVPDKKTVSNRSLINKRTDFSFTVPPYEEMIIKMKKWVDEHKKIYPHYFTN